MTIIEKNRIAHYFSIVYLSIISTLTFLGAWFFFLGTEEDVITLRDDLVVSVINRTVAVWVCALFFVLLLVLIDKFLFKQPIRYSARIGFYGLLLTFCSALAGSVLFFQ